MSFGTTSTFVAAIFLLACTTACHDVLSYADADADAVAADGGPSDGAGDVDHGGEDGGRLDGSKPISTPGIPRVYFARRTTSGGDELGMRELGIDGSWSESAPIAFVPGFQVHGLWAPSAPNGANELLLAAARGTASNGHLVLAHRPVGGSWLAAPLSNTLDVASFVPAAIEHERKSGDALIVFAHSASACHLRYRTISSDGALAEAQDVPLDAVPDCKAPVRVVRMVANPTNDQIALAFTSYHKGLYLLIWSGSSWYVFAKRIKLTDENEALTPDAFAWDMAYEQQSGRLAVIWTVFHMGNNTTKTREIRIPPPTSDSPPDWGAPKAFSPALPGDIVIAPDPASDGLAAVIGRVAQAGTQTAFTGLSWDGTWHQKKLAAYSCSDTHCPYHAAVGWLPDRPLAALAPTNHPTLDMLRSASIDDTGNWTMLADHKIVGLGAMTSVRMLGPLADGRALAVFAGENGRLFAAAGDGEGWETLWAKQGDAPVPLTDNLSAFAVTWAAPAP